MLRLIIMVASQNAFNTLKPTFVLPILLTACIGNHVVAVTSKYSIKNPY